MDDYRAKTFRSQSPVFTNNSLWFAPLVQIYLLPACDGFSYSRSYSLICDTCRTNCIAYGHFIASQQMLSFSDCVQLSPAPLGLRSNV